MKQNYFIQKNNFTKLLENFSRQYHVYTPTGETEYCWQSYSGVFEFNKYRPISSLRQFFTPSRESIHTYFSHNSKIKKPFCIVGAKNCDLASLAIHDFVFLEGTTDTHYQTMRNNNFIISSDCTGYKNVCFCLALGINPYPEKSFDFNLSPVSGGYIVMVGSPKGELAITNNKDLFKAVDDNHILEQTKKREDIVKNLTAYLKSQQLADKDALYNLVKDGYENAVWPQEALRCVECGACIMNCPTCHCFLLCDSGHTTTYVRAKIWDGCQYKNFTRVAGGANPLKLRQQRLRNRYVKKFEFFPDNIKTYACTGCGRCIESCPAKIDIREVFKQLAIKTPA
ncbi:MAG: 4Fe-4S dicluster domain-containing protein [Candidatus Omnitrophota bacterium]